MPTANPAPAELPLPPFYDPGNAGRWEYEPDQQALLEAAIHWRAEHGIQPAALDRIRIHLLLIDLQKDFCFPQGTLYVGGRSGRGAIEDNDRIARFIYRNLGVITGITCTLDTHFPYQIFSPAFWLGPDGEPPQPHREVTVEDIREGRLRPNPALAEWLADGDYSWLLRQVEFYCEELARTGKYRLYLWPPHVILGSAGHALAGVIHEARMFHAYARTARDWTEVKGTNPLTEYYSALGPEVTTTWDGKTLEAPNRQFIERLASSDAVIIAGQAASHCVKSTIEDLLTKVEARLVRKVYILEDCMSAVAIPDPGRPGEFLFDFTSEAEQALARFADAGMHVVRSTEPMESWLRL